MSSTRMSTARFCKKTVAEYLNTRLEGLEDRYGFRCTIGWVQVEGRGEEVNRAYGEYDALSQMLFALDLNEIDY